MTQRITLRVYRSELLYDIANKTYLYGRAVSDGTNDDKVALMRSDDDAASENEIARSIQTAVAQVRSLLSRYLVGPLAPLGTDELDDDSDIVIELDMPENFFGADSMSDLLHDFIVNVAIGKWMSIHSKDEASAYLTAAASSLDAIAATANKRKRPNKPEPYEHFR